MIELGHLLFTRFEPVWKQAGGDKKHFILSLAKQAATHIGDDGKRNSK